MQQETGKVRSDESASRLIDSAAIIFHHAHPKVVVDENGEIQVDRVGRPIRYKDSKCSICRKGMAGLYQSPGPDRLDTPVDEDSGTDEEGSATPPPLDQWDWSAVRQVRDSKK